MSQNASQFHTVPKRSVIVAGHRTSISLEQDYWRRLKALAAARGCSINDLVSEIDEARDTATINLSGACRAFVLNELAAAMGELLDAGTNEALHDGSDAKHAAAFERLLAAQGRAETILARKEAA